MLFIDRTDSGRRLADRLTHLTGPGVVVVGLPRGGVPVAYEVAVALNAPLDVIVVRKLGVPFQPELGMGAVGEGGVRVINDDVVRMAGVSPEELAAAEARERVEVDRRARRFRGDRPPVTLAGRTVVIVDDGIATGSTARAACQVARAAGAARVVLAVPVAPPGWERSFAGEADELITLETPGDFFAIGQYYRDFSQTPDDEVTGYLDQAARRPGTSAAPARFDPTHPRWWSTSTSRRVPGLCSCTDISSCPAMRTGSCCSRTAAAAAGTARATGMWPRRCAGPGWGRCCSTC